MPLSTWPILIALAYLLGSIPFGLIIARAHGIDIRSVGSGNIGATNVMRNIGKRAGALCFALDFLKGFAPVLAAGFITGAIGRDALPARDAWLWLAVAAATILGHVFPIWAGFRGGKGVATSFGAMLGVWPQLAVPALAAFAVWFTCQRITRNVGLSSSIAALLIPVGVAVTQVIRRGESSILNEGLPFIIVAALLAALVIWRHKSNLARTFAKASA